MIGKVALEPNLSYRLNGHNQFASVNIQTGEVRISAPLNREAITPNGTIILILTAEPTTIIAVRINVLDINDNSPTFPSKYMVGLRFSKSLLDKFSHSKDLRIQDKSECHEIIATSGRMSNEPKVD